MFATGPDGHVRGPQRLLQRTRPARAGAEPQLRDRPLRLRLLLAERLHDAGGGAVHRVRRRCERRDHPRHAAVRRRLLPQGRPARVREGRQAVRDPRRRALGRRRTPWAAPRRCRKTRTTSAARSCATNPTDRSRATTRSAQTARCGSPVSATRSASPSTPTATPFVTSNGPTGDIGTPATGYDLAFRVEAGGRYQWPACYGYSHLVPGATSCLGRAGTGVEQRGSRRSCRPAQPGSTTTVPTRTPATSCSAARAACASSRRAHRTRRCATAPSDCHLDVKEGPDHALYFSDETKIYRLAAA